MAGFCLVIIGPPGAGKSMQGLRLSEEFNAHFFSVGALIRETATTPTALGTQIMPILNAGEVVPTILLLPILENAIRAIPVDQPIIFDFAGTGEQCAAFDEMLARQGRTIYAAILIKVMPRELITRLATRGRPDDTPNLIRKRIAIYEREIVPMYSYYKNRGQLHIIDGSGSPDVVASRLLLLTQNLMLPRNTHLNR